MMMRIQSKRAGFTLIELLITMVLVAILATIAMQFLWSAKDRSLEATLQSDLKTLAVQQEVYFGRNFQYAPLPANLVELEMSPGVHVTINYAAADGWGATAAHVSTNKSCGMVIGAAPNGSGGPATQPGIVMCTGP